MEYSFPDHRVSSSFPKNMVNLLLEKRDVAIEEDDEDVVGNDDEERDVRSEETAKLDEIRVSAGTRTQPREATAACFSQRDQKCLVRTVGDVVGSSNVDGVETSVVLLKEFVQFAHEIVGDFASSTTAIDPNLRREIVLQGRSRLAWNDFFKQCFTPSTMARSSARAMGRNF